MSKATFVLKPKQKRILALMKSTKEKSNLKAKWQAQFEKNEAYLVEMKSRPLVIGLTPNGGVVIKNTGTRYGFAVLDEKRAAELLGRLDEFRTYLTQSAAGMKPTLVASVSEPSDEAMIESAVSEPSDEE